MRILWAFGLILAGAANGAVEPNQCATDGIAVGGYDLISYRQPGGPHRGEVDISAVHEGLTYRFATVENKTQFLETPDRYLPVYLGWCAATLAMGRLACPDHTNFKIEDGRLLLFELAGFTNGRTVWDSNPTDFKRRADENFDKLLVQ